MNIIYFVYFIVIDIIFDTITIITIIIIIIVVVVVVVVVVVIYTIKIEDVWWNIHACNITNVTKHFRDIVMFVWGGAAFSPLPYPIRVT